MRIGSRALGQASTPANCGTNPCDWTDYLWVSDECQTYLACANLPPMTFSGQIGAGIHSIISGAGSAAVTGITGQPAGSTLSSVVGSGLLIGGVAIIGLILVLAVKR